ncbi:DUF6753 family protein [Duganella aceris]|uniref:Protein mobE n=1 Tax=Duganella aceris TaxID=2703883 RepID=A0ABX0FT07_9BURK|nr:DUF6753 family protein [Duganella aceris]NGZ87525.1 protein mobE [Duganella aceris]
MNELEDSFAKLLGRQPTDAERHQLYQVRDALALKNNDALWLILMALQYHQTMYARFPELIKQAAVETLRQFQQTAEGTLTSAKESAKAELAKAVSTAARDVARLTAARQAATWIAACLLGCSVTLGTFGWYIHRMAYEAGYDKGYGEAYADTKDDKAAAAWANTPQGKAAYHLALAGSIDRLARCDQPGWKTEHGICYVYPTPLGKIYGWKIR